MRAKWMKCISYQTHRLSLPAPAGDFTCRLQSAKALPAYNIALTLKQLMVAAVRSAALSMLSGEHGAMKSSFAVISNINRSPSASSALDSFDSMTARQPDGRLASSIRNGDKYQIMVKPSDLSR